MAGRVERAKGQARQAVGALTGNKDLESEGKADRRVGETKEQVRQVNDRTEERLVKVEHKAGT